MAMNQQSVLYDVQQLKVYAFATPDVVGGASPTFSPGIICQGVADITLTPTIQSTQLKGDGGRVISDLGRVEMFDCQATYGRLGLDAMAVMVGGITTDTGTGAAEQVVWSLAAPNLLPHFKVEFQIANTDNGVGGINVVLYNCTLKSATFIDSKTDAFGQPKFDVTAVPLLSTGAIGEVIFDATLTPLD